MAAPQNYKELKSRILENVDLQNGYPSPPHFFEERKLKVWYHVPNNFPQKTDESFFEISPVCWENRL